MKQYTSIFAEILMYVQDLHIFIFFNAVGGF
jgi:hypothetical protein